MLSMGDTRDEDATVGYRRGRRYFKDTKTKPGSCLVEHIEGGVLWDRGYCCKGSSGRRLIFSCTECSHCELIMMGDLSMYMRFHVRVPLHLIHKEIRETINYI